MDFEVHVTIKAQVEVEGRIEEKVFDDDDDANQEDFRFIACL